jgi:hypothetical protein
MAVGEGFGKNLRQTPSKRAFLPQAFLWSFWYTSFAGPVLSGLWACKENEQDYRGNQLEVKVHIPK